MSATGPILPEAHRPRLMSLDVFRGLTILLMILVNNGSTQSFPQLQHAAWNGWTLTDVVFPFFLFITGVSLTFSHASRMRASPAETPDSLPPTAIPPVPSRSRLLLHIARRFAILFAIGLLLNAFPDYHLATWRVPGVLQRIALCYFGGSVLYLWTSARTRWILIAALLIGYWFLMRFVPVPGCGIPTVNIPLLDPDCNLVACLDRKLMWGHLYERMRDPEGILSTFPALASTLFGVAAGEWIRALPAQPAKLFRRLIAVGFACFLAGELWSRVFPINKKLWTSSYVLLTAGLALLTLAACYWLFDVKKMRGRWTIIPLVFGTNCIFAYAFSEFVAIAIATFKLQLDGKPVSYKDALSSFTFDYISQPQWSSLAFALFYAAFCWWITWLLYRRKIFLKI